MNFTNFRGLLSESSFEGEKVRVLVIGSPEGVTEIIHTLHNLRFAEVGSWSRLLPIPDEAAVMSILTRRRSRD